MNKKTKSTIQEFVDSLSSKELKKYKDFTLQSFLKILKGLGSKGLMVELHGQYIPLDIPPARKR